MAYSLLIVPKVDKETKKELVLVNFSKIESFDLIIKDRRTDEDFFSAKEKPQK